MAKKNNRGRGPSGRRGSAVGATAVRFTNARTGRRVSRANATRRDRKGNVIGFRGGLHVHDSRGGRTHTGSVRGAGGR